MQGYTKVPGKPDQPAQCVPQSQVDALPRWAIALIITGCLIAFLLMLLLVSYLLQSIKHRPKVFRRLEMMKKKMKGLPREGDAFAIVVTDIEGYSGEHHIAVLSVTFSSDDDPVSASQYML